MKNLFILFVLLITLKAGAELPAHKKTDLPLYEAGLGAAVFSLPDYPGAAQSRTRQIIFPDVMFRGEILRADEKEGARARFSWSEWHEIDLSASGGFAADSNQNEARRGMPDLDWIFELGPRFIYKFNSDSVDSITRIIAPIRGVFSTNMSSVKHHGAMFPFGIYNQQRRLFNGRVGLVSQLLFSYATRGVAEYYYEVESQYAKPSRATYKAREGFFSAELYEGISIEITKKITAYIGLQWNSYQYSANKKSPLLKEDLTFAGFLGITWNFYESEARGVE